MGTCLKALGVKMTWVLVFLEVQRFTEVVIRAS